MRIALMLGLTVVMTGCAGAPSDGVPAQPATSAVTSADPRAAPGTELPAATVAYLKAWAANDVATMIGNSAPGSPARAYAEYWGDVYRAGRLDTGTAELKLGPRSATLTYDDGTTYRMVGFADHDGLVTWSARPGGGLGPRIVAGPAASQRVGGVRVTALRQYVNSESGLRVSLRLRNSASARRDVETPGYVSPDGSRSPAAVGSGGRTGVVPTAPGSRSAALVSVPHARPGGRLVVRVYGRTGRPRYRTLLELPR
jgi:hypothetical protein